MKWIPQWLRSYRRSWLAGDLTAGLIITVLLIPQSLAYATLAGLPPQVGLYASILPLIAYATFGTSMTLAVGPVAVVSLMTASALQPLAAAGSPEYVALAVQLALLSGAILITFGALHLGFIAQFLSRPVVEGFISGSAILIALSQLKPLLGIPALTSITQLNPATAAIGLATIAFLVGARAYASGLAGKLAPMAAIIVTTAIAATFDLDAHAGRDPVLYYAMFKKPSTT